MVFNSDVFQRRCEILLYVCALWPRVLLSSWPHASPLCHLHSSLLLIHLQNCFCHDAMWWGGSPSTEGVHPWPRTYITHSNKNWRLPPPFFFRPLSLFRSLSFRVKAKKGVNLLQTKSKNAQWKVDWEVQSGAKHSITTIEVNKNKGVKAGWVNSPRPWRQRLNSCCRCWFYSSPARLKTGIFVFPDNEQKATTKFSLCVTKLEFSPWLKTAFKRAQHSSQMP